MKFRCPASGKLLDVAFFAGFLAYAVTGIDTRLIYHWQAPVFYLTREFASDFPKYPGGFIEWVYALVAQTYTWQLWGAVLLTAQVIAVTALTGVLCRRRSLLRYIPAVLLLYSLNLYYDRTPLTLALVVALIAAILVQRSKRATIGLFTLLLPAVYYFGGIALVFFALAAVGAQMARRQYANAITAALLAAAAPLALEHSRLIYMPASARDWFIDPDIRKAAIRWSLYIFYAVATYMWGGLPAEEQIGKTPERRKVTQRRWRAVVAPVAIMACLAAVAVLAYRTNARDRRLAALDYYTSREDWPEVIDGAQRLAAADFNSLTRYEVNLALHETNRLGDEMFRLPQAGAMMPALRTELFLPYMIRITDLLLRLGRIDDAEHFGNMALILSQTDPDVLRLMADVNMAKGQTGAARKLLTVLSHEAGSASWARRRLREMDQDPQMAADPYVELLRRRMPRNDDVGPVWQNPDKPDADVNRMLLDQLDQDPSNRMAFEFLMGNYLLARDLPSARALMPRIRYMTGPAYETPDGRRRTPRHYQEAMAMYGDGAGAPVELEGLLIEQETLSRMAIFKRLMSQSPGRDAAMEAAWDGFRHSYFFYYVFGPGDYR